MLTDDAKDPRAIPTRVNILDAMHWLVTGAKTHDSLFFHCAVLYHVYSTHYLTNCVDSGHGGQTKDQDGDEADGYDEAIYPVDFNQVGHIVDDVS